MKMRRTTLALAFFAITGVCINAQTKNDVITAYNEGAKAMQTDVPAAIKSFETVVTLSEQVGEEVADLKQKAVSVLPGLYVKVAKAALDEKKPAAEIIAAAKTAGAAAQKYNNPTAKTNSDKLLVQGYNAMAVEFFGRNDYPNALTAFDSLLAINPDYSNAIYNKALIYVKQGNDELFEQTMDLYLTKMKSPADDEKSKKASTMALEYFRSAGSKDIQANKLDDALAMLNKAAKYGEDKDLYYFFADVYNKKSNFDSGLENAQKGLAMETGDDTAKAKFHYQIAVAQVGKGQTAEACASFKLALFGPFAEAAKAQRTNLKCQ